MRVHLALLVLLTLFAGCSSSLLIESNNNAPSDVTGRNVLILAPPDNSVTVVFPEDVRKIFPNDNRPPNAILRSAFCRTLYKMVRETNFVQGQNLFSADSLSGSFTNDMKDFFIKEIPVGKDAISTTFFLPTKEWLLKKGKNPDIIAIVNSLAYSQGSTSAFTPGYFTPGMTFSTPQGKFSTGGVFVGGGGGGANLFANIQFIIYDYVHDRWISCGIPEISEKTAISGLTRSIWQSSFEDVIISLFEKSPWEGKINNLMAK